VTLVDASSDVDVVVVLYAVQVSSEAFAPLAFEPR
jgi:hypothetical protein